MKRGTKMYYGLNPVTIVKAPKAVDMLVEVRYASDVFNDTGTIVRKKGDKTKIHFRYLTTSPNPTL